MKQGIFKGQYPVWYRKSNNHFWTSCFCFYSWHLVMIQHALKFAPRNMIWRLKVIERRLNSWNNGLDRTINITGNFSFHLKYLSCLLNHGSHCLHMLVKTLPWAVFQHCKEVTPENIKINPKTVGYFLQH